MARNHNCPSPKQSVPCCSECSVILSLPEEENILPFVVCAKIWHFYPSVQFSSVAQSCLTLCDPMKHSTPGLAVHPITNSQSLPKPRPIESIMPSNHLILCRPLLLLPSIIPSIRVFSNESALRIRGPKDWSFSFNISPSSEYPGLSDTYWVKLSKHLILFPYLKTDDACLPGKSNFEDKFFFFLNVWPVQFSHSVVSGSLQPHGLQHVRLPCPSPAPRAHSDSSPSSQWCHPTISSSVVPSSSHL